MNPEKKIAKLEAKVSILEKMVADQRRAMFLTREKLEQSYDSLEQFDYVASHHLQEPLRMITSYLQLLSKHYGSSLDTTAHEYIGFAISGAQRMKQLILDLLDYSVVSKQTKECVAVNTQKALTQALKNLENAILETNAQITYDAMPTVMGNEHQIEQLFQQLISNAIKFHPENVTPSVHISAFQKDAEWKFSIRDNGIGISKEYFDKIFIIFHRLHGNNEYPGTGIGLAMCQAICLNHGGKIWVESELGKGSHFQFTIST